MIITVYSQGDIYKLHGLVNELLTEDVDNTILNGNANSFWSDDGEVLLAVCGMNSIWKGFAEFWGFYSTNLQDYKFEFIRFARKTLPNLMERMNLHRIQCTVSALEPQHIRFNKLLGFEEECVLESASPAGGDMVIMRILR